MKLYSATLLVCILLLVHRVASVFGMVQQLRRVGGVRGARDAKDCLTPYQRCMRDRLSEQGFQRVERPEKAKTVEHVQAICMCYNASSVRTCLRQSPAVNEHLKMVLRTLSNWNSKVCTVPSIFSRVLEGSEECISSLVSSCIVGGGACECPKMDDDGPAEARQNPVSADQSTPTDPSAPAHSGTGPNSTAHYSSPAAEPSSESPSSPPASTTAVPGTSTGGDSSTHPSDPAAEQTASSAIARKRVGAALLAVVIVASMSAHI